MARIQFYIGKWMGAKTSLNGYVIAGNEGLGFVLHEGEVERSVLEEETRNLSLPWRDVAELSVDHGLLDSVLVIGLVTPPLGGEWPGLKGRKMSLRVQRKDREALDDFLGRAQALQRGEQDPDVDDVLDDVRDFLEGI